MIYKKINIEDFWFFILFFTIAFLLLGAMTVWLFVNKYQ